VERLQNASRLHVRVERLGSIVVLDLTGRLTVEADIDRLRGLTEWLPRLGGNLVMLDLERVHQMDCSGIGQLAGLCNDVHVLGGAFVLVNVGRGQRRLLQLVGLVPVFPIFGSRQEALSWFHETTAQRPEAKGSHGAGRWLDSSLPRLCFGSPASARAMTSGDDHVRHYR
jgi:anti-anti-sigma factor